MTNASNDLALALLATLEARAKKKGRKSLLKPVLDQLRQSGADDRLVAKVLALGEPASAEPVAAPDTPAPKPAAKTKTKPARVAAPTA